MLLPLLLLGGGGLYLHKKKKDEEKRLVEIAQNHRAEAARQRLRADDCYKQLAKYNPVLEPSFMDPASAMAGDVMTETGESYRNL